MPERIGDKIWEAGDHEVIENFTHLLFPNGSMKDCLPRNVSSRCAEVWNGHHVSSRLLVLLKYVF